MTGPRSSAETSTAGRGPDRASGSDHAWSPRAFVDRPHLRERSALRLGTLGVRLAMVVVAIGAAVLVGYVVRVGGIVRLSPRLPPMYPNAALGLVCGGVAVAASTRTHAWRLCAALGVAGIGGIGAIGLALHVAEAGRTWFEALFPTDFVAATTPVGGRPAPETCVAFILLAGASATLVARRWSLIGQAMGAGGAAVGVSAVVGYLLGVDRAALGGSAVFVGMALHTGVGIALLGVAIVLVRPNVGFVGQLLDGGVGGRVTRRVATAVASACAALVLAGAVLSHVLPTGELFQSVFSVVQVAVLGAAVLIPAGVITGTERELREQLDLARRRDEHRDDVDTVIEAITAEMIITRPELPGWDIGMCYQPATGHLAGDSVQVHVRERPRPATLIAVVDVAGHDAYSAVVAYGLRAHVGALWEHGASLQEIVASTNAKLVRRETIATGVLIAFEHDSTALEIVNAGHPAPIHLRARDVTEWERTGPLLGIPVDHHDVRQVEIAPDDLVVIYTDGVVEARTADGRQLGEDIVHRLVVARRSEPVDAIAGALVDAALQHAESRLRDDALVIAARRLPPG